MNSKKTFAPDGRSRAIGSPAPKGRERAAMRALSARSLWNHAIHAIVDGPSDIGKNRCSV